MEGTVILSEKKASKGGEYIRHKNHFAKEQQYEIVFKTTKRNSF